MEFHSLMLYCINEESGLTADHVEGISRFIRRSMRPDEFGDLIPVDIAISIETFDGRYNLSFKIQDKVADPLWDLISASDMKCVFISRASGTREYFQFEGIMPDFYGLWENWKDCRPYTLIPLIKKFICKWPIPFSPSVLSKDEKEAV
jgi:hypothetical protein